MNQLDNIPFHRGTPRPEEPAIGLTVVALVFPPRLEGGNFLPCTLFFSRSHALLLCWFITFSLFHSMAFSSSNPSFISFPFQLVHWFRNIPNRYSPDVDRIPELQFASLGHIFRFHRPREPGIVFFRKNTLSMNGQRRKSNSTTFLRPVLAH